MKLTLLVMPGAVNAFVSNPGVPGLLSISMRWANLIADKQDKTLDLKQLREGSIYFYRHLLWYYCLTNFHRHVQGT